MPARIVIDIDVSDWEQYRKYQQQAGPTLQAYGGTFSVLGTDGEALEGDWAPKTLAVLEFPDAEAARRWYNSPEYVEARKLRQGAARLNFALLKVTYLPAEGPYDRSRAIEADRRVEEPRRPAAR